MLFFPPNSSQILPTQLQVLSSCLKPKPEQDHHIFHLTAHLLSGLSFSPPQNSIFLLEAVNSGNFQRDKNLLEYKYETHGNFSWSTTRPPSEMAFVVCQCMSVGWHLWLRSNHPGNILTMQWQSVTKNVQALITGFRRVGDERKKMGISNKCTEAAADLGLRLHPKRLLIFYYKTEGSQVKSW